MGVTVIDITTDPVAFITGANIHRRHLLPEVKRDLIAALLREHPERSDRATAELAKVDHKTVAAVRRREEDVGSIPHVDGVADTKGRRQPTGKPKVQAAAKSKPTKEKRETGEKVSAKEQVTRVRDLAQEERARDTNQKPKIRTAKDVGPISH